MTPTTKPPASRHNQVMARKRNAAVRKLQRQQQTQSEARNIGIARQDDHYVITAEFKDGYVVLGIYPTLTKAKRALPGVKRAFEIVPGAAS